MKTTIKSQLTRLNKAKPYGPERCPILLKLPYVRSESKLVDKKIVDMTNRTYFSVNLIIIFISKPILQQPGKDPILPEEKSFAV